MEPTAAAPEAGAEPASKLCKVDGTGKKAGTGKKDASPRAAKAAAATAKPKGTGKRKRQQPTATETDPEEAESAGSVDASDDGDGDQVAASQPQPTQPPEGMCVVLTTSLAFTLKQLSEFCRVCCISVVPIHLDRVNGFSVAFGDATARMTVRVRLPPSFFDSFQIRDDEVVLGVEAGEFADICRRIKRRDSAAIYVDEAKENFSVAVRFGEMHINALDTKVSPTQVVLHDMPLDQYAAAGIQPLAAAMGTLHRVIKNMRTRTDRVHVRGRVSQWVEFSYINETNRKSRDCFSAKDCGQGQCDPDEPADYGFNVLVAHLSRALRMILLGPTSYLYIGPNLPLRISTPVADSRGGCAEFILAPSP